MQQDISLTDDEDVDNKEKQDCAEAAHEVARDPGKLAACADWVETRDETAEFLSEVNAR